MGEKVMKKKEKEKRAQLPFRLNILFFSVFLLFSILILQLGVVQILRGETFQEEIDQTTQDVIKVPVPRGKIYDRNYKIVVDNEPIYAITYTPPKGVQPKQRLELAETLVKFMSMDIYDDKDNLTGISLRNKREYWYLKNTEEAEKLLTSDEREGMNNGEQYNEILQRIPDEEIDKLTDKELQIIAIKKELDKAYELTPQIIKNEGVTLEEYARVGENLDQLPGVNVTTDWDRVYENRNSFHAYLGSITTQNQGILADKEQFYLTRGYSRNDRVGRSGLEAQYEDVLRGRKEQIEYVTDKNGKVVDSNILVPGERGKDLVLTLDMEYGKRVDQILQRELETAIEKTPSYYRQLLEEALAVVINPKTGEILAISGQRYNHDTKEFEDVALNAIHDTHLPGSTVKGATILAGFQSGVVSPGHVIVDKPIINAGSNPKGSWMNLGPVNDIDALERSSNVYMYHIAMRVSGNPVYRENASLTFNKGSFQKMRNYFQQFGLGTETGIDYPNEAKGLSPNAEGLPDRAGLLQNYAIGQYDTFTTLQLAQYVSTIANDGYRVRPHLVKEIREPTPYADELGPVYRSMNTDVLNKIEMDNAYIQRVQEGFRRAFQGTRGTASAYFSDRDYNPAGKTGTAEEFKWIDGKMFQTENLALVGYAPFDDPEVAFAVIVPHTHRFSDRHPINNLIGRGILDSYFELKEEREQGNTNEVEKDREDDDEEEDE